MFQRAVDLGLPASFVELRHEATHREPPSLVVLRKASQRSLEWLWDNYWAGVDELGDVPMAEHNDKSSIGSALSEILQNFSTESDQLQKKRKRNLNDAVATQLVSTCALSDKGMQLLATSFLEGSILVDSERK